MPLERVDAISSPASETPNFLKLAISPITLLAASAFKLPALRIFLIMPSLDLTACAKFSPVTPVFLATSCIPLPNSDISLLLIFICNDMFRKVSSKAPASTPIIFSVLSCFFVILSDNF